MTAFYAELLEAEVSWGEDMKKTIRPLVECSDDLKKAARNRIRWFDREHSIPAEEIEKNNDVLYWGGDDSAYEKKLKAAVEKVEDFLKPYLGRPQAEKKS